MNILNCSLCKAGASLQMWHRNSKHDLHKLLARLQWLCRRDSTQCWAWQWWIRSSSSNKCLCSSKCNDNRCRIERIRSNPIFLQKRRSPPLDMFASSVASQVTFEPRETFTCTETLIQVVCKGHWIYYCPNVPKGQFVQRPGMNGGYEATWIT